MKPRSPRNLDIKFIMCISAVPQMADTLWKITMKRTIRSRQRLRWKSTPILILLVYNSTLKSICRRKPNKDKKDRNSRPLKRKAQAPLLREQRQEPEVQQERQSNG